MVKLKLELEPDPEITVIGISSHVNDYRLCWSLNKAMHLELTRRRTDIADVTSGRMAHYTAYDHEAEEGVGRYTLVNNHSSEGILLREQRQADFFLVVDNDLAAGIPDLLDRVRAAEFVLAAFLLDYDKLRSGHKLLL